MQASMEALSLLASDPQIAALRQRHGVAVSAVSIEPDGQLVFTFGIAPGCCFLFRKWKVPKFVTLLSHTGRQLRARIEVTTGSFTEH